MEKLLKGTAPSNFMVRAFTAWISAAKLSIADQRSISSRPMLPSLPPIRKSRQLSYRIEKDHRGSELKSEVEDLICTNLQASEPTLPSACIDAPPLLEATAGWRMGRTLAATDVGRGLRTHRHRIERRGAGSKIRHDDDNRLADMTLQGNLSRS